jgi:hypothetical protein
LNLNEQDRERSLNDRNISVLPIKRAIVPLPKNRVNTRCGFFEIGETNSAPGQLEVSYVENGSMGGIIKRRGPNIKKEGFEDRASSWRTK